MWLCLISPCDFITQHAAWYKGHAQEMLKEKDSWVFLKNRLCPSTCWSPVSLLSYKQDQLTSSDSGPKCWLFLSSFNLRWGCFSSEPSLRSAWIWTDLSRPPNSHTLVPSIGQNLTSFLNWGHQTVDLWPLGFLESILFLFVSKADSTVLWLYDLGQVTYPLRAPGSSSVIWGN